MSVLFDTMKKHDLTYEHIWMAMFDKFDWDLKPFRADCPRCEEQLRPKRNGKFRVDFPTPRFYCQKCRFAGTKGPAVALLLGSTSGYKESELVNGNSHLTDFAEELILSMLGIDGVQGYQAKDDLLTDNIIQKLIEDQRSRQVAVADCPVADIETQNEVYNFFLKNMVHQENPFMMEDLLRRGLTEEDILKYGMVSTQLCQDLSKLLVEFGGDLDGIPGLYREGAMIKSTILQAANNETAESYLFPVKNISGQICGLQIRTNLPKNKYVFVSSGRVNGPAPKTYPHFVGYLEETMILTEGIIKANVINKFTDRFVCAVPGVNSIRYLLEELRKAKRANMGIKRIVIAYDMDAYENENVYKALMKLQDELVKAGFIVNILTWDKSYKGLDDYLLELHNQGNLSLFEEEFNKFLIY